MKASAVEGQVPPFGTQRRKMTLDLQSASLAHVLTGASYKLQFLPQVASKWRDQSIQLAVCEQLSVNAGLQIRIKVNFPYTFVNSGALQYDY